MSTMSSGYVRNLSIPQKTGGNIKRRIADLAERVAYLEQSFMDESNDYYVLRFYAWSFFPFCFRFPFFPLIVSVLHGKLFISRLRNVWLVCGGIQIMRKAFVSCLTISLFFLLLCGIASAEISIPQNVAWKDDSAATATWPAVENANYYYLQVFVYHDNELLGSTYTGTTDTSIDVQQEIHRMVSKDQYDDIHFHCDDYGSITIAVLKEGISLETIAQISYEDQLKYLAVPPTNLYAPGVVHLSIEENQTLYVEIVSGTGVLTIERVNGLFQ